MRVSGGGADDEAAARLRAGVVAYALDVPQAKLIGRGRGSSEIAFARQAAMYLCHVGFELSLSRVASAFCRDRSTVTHACHVIEDGRDEDRFDAWFASLEAMVRPAPLPSERPRELRR
jgi:chromosomal replication initiation ATPase DnaA